MGVARTGYQLVGPRPWPLRGAFSVLGLCSGLLIFFSEGITWPFWVVFFGSLSLIVFTLSNWWIDLVKERTFLGEWRSYVLRTYVIGFRLFIISEIFFFVGLFGCYVYCGVGEISLQGVGFWPPRGIKPLHPGKVALLNTGILVLSSFTANWAFSCVEAHNATPLVHRKPYNFSNFPFYAKFAKKGLGSLILWLEALFSLGLTIVLGFCFSYCQALEYYWCSFRFADGIWGSIFYLLTGFHGIHVVVGTIFLIVCWFRLLKLHFSYNHFYFGIWAAVWYWHFVDGVWIAVFFLVYVWGYWGYT